MTKYPFLTAERTPYQLMNHYLHVDLELFSVYFLSRIASSFQGLFGRMAFCISGEKALRGRLLAIFSDLTNAYFWSLCFRGMQSHDLPAMRVSVVLDLC